MHYTKESFISGGSLVQIPRPIYEHFAIYGYLRQITFWDLDDFMIYMIEVTLGRMSFINQIVKSNKSVIGSMFQSC